ncbi:hypothetical protein O185_25475 [Photorhabdus temperata J3]|uniref:Uncharacterized protein n=1 Tax=Photorhabdus temperata J3 TaxID=1389415 RepID=U7QR37_PHOTE|nr:hypothetical protein O185_25475 [Photorhabdus temperata J3]
MEYFIPINQMNYLLRYQENYCYTVVDFITINQAIASES